jgi:hypothetical protein
VKFKIQTPLRFRRHIHHVLVMVQMEIHEIEERKNLHINKLISNHDKAYQEIKEYYYDITKDNLDLIKSLNVRFINFIFNHFCFIPPLALPLLG